MTLKKSKKGVLVVEFMFVFVVSLIFVLYFFLLSMTFVQIEISQYIAFKTSREYMIDGGQPELKFTHLKDRLIFKAENWWELEEEPTLGFGIFSQRSNPIEDKGLFDEGAQLNFKSKVLKFKIPFLGGSSEEVNFEIASFLGKEPSKEECQRFFRESRKVFIGGVVGGSTNAPGFLVPSNLSGSNGC